MLKPCAPLAAEFLSDSPATLAWLDGTRQPCIAGLCIVLPASPAITPYERCSGCT
jgi:hypothetical protein